MEQAQDDSPGPVALAISREWYERGLRTLTPQEMEIVRRIEAGENRTTSLAKQLGLTAGRISQIRRAAAEKLDE